MNFEVVWSLIGKARSLGSRRLDDGTELIGKVPHIAPEAWFHQVYAPLSSEQVAQLERQMREVPLPPVYREFLTSCCNGLGVFCDSLCLFGFRRNYVRTGDGVWQPYALETPNVLERESGSGLDEFFFGCYGCDGSLIFLKRGRVYRRSRASRQPLNEWADFRSFLVSEVERLATLFDQQGRAKNTNMPTTP
jgi:hypothetical protein